MFIIPSLSLTMWNPLLWVVPLALGVSFAYTASRYEDQTVILQRGFSFFWKTLLFMALIFVVLYLLSHGL